MQIDTKKAYKNRENGRKYGNVVSSTTSRKTEEHMKEDNPSKVNFKLPHFVTSIPHSIFSFLLFLSPFTQIKCIDIFIQESANQRV